MSNQEPETLSPAEIRQMMDFERGEQVSVVDGLVYTALGMYSDNDYIGLAQATIELGGLSELAQAEARLEIIQE